MEWWGLTAGGSPDNGAQRADDALPSERTSDFLRKAAGNRYSVLAIGSGSVQERWIRKTISLAFLCPALVEVAIDGRVPRGFGVKRLIELPMAWPDQWWALGLRAPTEL